MADRPQAGAAARWRAGLAALYLLRPAAAGLVKLCRRLDAAEQAAGAAAEQALARLAEAGGGMAAALWRSGRALPLQVAEQVVWSEHALAARMETDGPGAAFPPALAAAAARELRLLQELATALPRAIDTALADGGWPPGTLVWPDLASSESDAASDLASRLAASPAWPDFLPELAAAWADCGAGPLGRYDAFRWDGRTGRLTPIKHPDPVTLADLHGYARQRQAVLANTEQFVAGLPANNLLLYGDRGTGKSSLVKALRPAFRDRGLRLIEVSRPDLNSLPGLLALLAGRRARCIVFLDDLSFSETDDYRGLKAVLEGSLVARPKNVLIYATTNRRHLVHETRGERAAAARDGETAHNARQALGAEAPLNPRDVLQEKLSLADRFGQTIAFPSPDQDDYLAMAVHLARRMGLTLPDDEVKAEALQWAQWHQARSGRTARQFVDALAGRLGHAGGNTLAGD